MRLTNTTDDIRTTWTGTEIQPGQTRDVEVADNELAWLLARGCVKADDPEEPPKPKRRPSRRVPRMDSDE